jgi:two-component system sensor histidine kinase BaeS
MNRLWVRLTAAILLVAWIVLAVVTLVVHQAVDASFRQYVGASAMDLSDPALLAALQDYYAANGSWDGAEALLPVMGRGMGERRGRGGIQSFIAAPDGRIVVSTDEALLGAALASLDAYQGTPLVIGGDVVGTLGQRTPAAQALGRAEEAFIGQVSQALLITALLATLLALFLGLLFAYWLARPLQRLAQHIAHLAPPHLGEPAAVEGPREVRQLATSFNAMSWRIAEGERLRRQMTSDVAHELRTPVTVLRGHLEAMMDGVYPLDIERLAVAYDQTLHLARLVEDLRLLTQAESGRLALQLAVVAPAALVQEAATRFAPLAQDAGVTLESAAEARLSPVQVDEGRLRQVFDNLLTNALRHTPPGGSITIAAAQAGDRMQFRVSNSGHLSPENLEHIFDRFWRGDDARQSDAGGSGLGLAITRQLVVLHEGTIRAESSGGVTSFIVDLPCTHLPGAGYNG